VAKDKKPKGSKATPDFDIDDPNLPDWISEAALTADNYPYDDRLKRKTYQADLEALQIELAKLQVHALTTGMRIVAVFEGRDSAGKGSCIKRFMEYINPRHAHAVALPSQPSANANSGIFSATPHIYQAPAKSFCSTDHGIIEQASNVSWSSAR